MYMAFAGIDRVIPSGKLTDKQFKVVLEEICRYYGTSEVQIKSTSRKQAIVKARQMLCYVLRERFYYTSFAKIGAYINRNHATVLYACNLVKSNIELYSRDSEEYAAILKYLDR